MDKKWIAVETESPIEAYQGAAQNPAQDSAIANEGCGSTIVSMGSAFPIAVLSVFGAVTVLYRKKARKRATEHWQGGAV